jgi:hypothetical protein
MKKEQNFFLSTLRYPLVPLLSIFLKNGKETHKNTTEVLPPAKFQTNLSGSVSWRRSIAEG